MTCRSFEHLSSIMPRFYLFNIYVLFCSGLLIMSVLADFKDQPDLERTQLTVDSDSVKQEAVPPILCDCEFFVQSWKTSHMIRLPMGIQPVRANSTTETSNSDTCILLCQKQLPPLPEDENDSKWARIFKGACRTLLANEFSSRHGGLVRMTNALVGHSTTGNDEEPVRGCLQAFARSTHARIWVPMGLQYRKLLSCSHPRRRRSLTEGRKLSNSKSSLNSVDAQSAVDDAEEGIVVNAAAQSTDETTTPKPNNSPLRILLKRFGLVDPVVDSLFYVFENGGWLDLLNNFKLGPYVDRYQRLADDYAEEMDVGHCFFEYLTYNAFNNRFVRRALRSSSRGLEDDAVGFMLNAATGLLKSENASQVLSSLFSMFPSSKRVEREEASNGSDQKPPPDGKEVVMSITRFYLRNYFSGLSGSNVRMNEKDPINNPESLADMIEQFSRPFFLSVFGVVPGAPASGNLHNLLMNSEKPEVTENEIGMRTPEFRNKLVPIAPTRASDGLIEPITLSTGNSFFDFGNTVFATFQRANDATHGLYCVKQYTINKVWDYFSKSMRKMMRAIPKAG